ncbi:unnamed protein product [Lymnaea stagnalis]|uniref:Hexosyltransferase n=1 Tax=Lymnaea stagnalis TaxID=6523 RepID=A0AAV2HUX9_LYMST
MKIWNNWDRIIYKQLLSEVVNSLSPYIMKFKWQYFIKLFGLKPKNPPSGVYVSVNVPVPKRRKLSSGLSRHSTKAVIKVSIWTLVTLLLAFLLIYTILLAYVDTHLHPSIITSPGVYKKVKFQGRYSLGIPKQKPNNSLTINILDGKKVKSVWNSSSYYLENEPLPNCKWQTIFRVIVASAVENTGRRKEIRNTWCNPERFSSMPDHAWHCIFLVGKPDNDDSLFLLNKEKMQYNDLLVGNYADSYRNLTLKVIHGFNWSANYCPSSYIIKTDDDCFVNTGLLHEFLLHHNDKTSGLYAGRVFFDSEMLQVIRGDSNRWSVPYDQYPDKFYPPYASGLGYIISTDVVKKLVHESQYVIPFANEDAYIGVVMSKIGIKPITSNRFLLGSTGLSLCNFRYLFIVHGVEKDQQSVLLRKALEAPVSCNRPLITSWS